MSREYNIHICKENKEIVRDNGFWLNGEFVSLPCELKAHQKVRVLSPEKIESIVMDEDDFFELSFWGSSKCRIAVVNADSFAYPTDLVMNFANAIRPGGGYKTGANAQEEALCRQSTLYASIGSDTAHEMYAYNKRLNAPFDSDYMLISPYVDVFRDADLNLLNRPYTTAVMTIPAPNLKGRARNESAETVAVVMKMRIRQYLICAARYGYRTITLGAWGCGAFGHDAKQVAGYFHEILVEEKMWEYFDQILFAVYDKTVAQYNYRAFKDVFSDVEQDISEWKSLEDENRASPYFVQAEKRFPVCNHTQEVSDSNIGFCQGIGCDGIPFEAELWVNGDERAITVIIPENTLPIVEKAVSEESNVIGYRTEQPYRDYSVLWIGMVERGQESDDEVVQYYVSYLKKIGMIQFVGGLENGSVIYCTDSAGNDLVHITVTLEQNGSVLAKTPLNFVPFFEKRKKGAVIPFMPFQNH